MPIDYGQAINQGVNQYFQGRRLGNDERQQMLEEQRMIEAQKRAEEAAEYERSMRPLREQALQNQVESQGIDTQQRRAAFENQQGLQRGMTQAWKDSQVPDGTMQPYPDDTEGFAPIEPEYAGGLKKRGMVTDMGRYNQGMEQAYGEFAPQQIPDLQRRLAEAKKEGAIDAMRMAMAGDYEQANQVLASTGARRQDRMSPHPTKKGVAIVSTPEGKHEVNLAQALQAMGAGEKPMILNRGDKAFMGGQMIAENPYEQGGGSSGAEGGGGEKFYNIAIQTERGPVQKTFSNNEAIAFYKQIHGFPDDQLMMTDYAEYNRRSQEAAKNAPSFQQWLSQSIVGGIGGQQPQSEPVNMEAERRLAEQDVRRDMGIMDYIPFNEPSSDQIDQRLQQRRGMAGGLTQPQEVSRPSMRVPQENQAAPRQAPDGNWYIPDPNRPGKYLRVN